MTSRKKIITDNEGDQEDYAVENLVAPSNFQ